MWVGIRRLHGVLIFALEAFPLLFQGFALHVR
jgi:hypothetical protein